MGKIELMAPAGGFDCLQVAINEGADSVFFGIEQLNMRARATMNFTLGDLREISLRCQEKKIRTYLTLNTIIYNHDLSVIKRIISQVKETKISAIIASDQAVINYASSIGVEVHISTQLNITNIETVKFYSHFSDLMVLSRELSLRQVKEITNGIIKDDVRGPKGELIKIEIFGHGALCVATSGKCYMSLHTQNSSANRGACVQNCRRRYRVIDIEDGHELEIDNEYIMSAKDLCTINFLDQVKYSGVSVLKIEGRGRSPEYVKTVTKAYREAIDSLDVGNYSKERISIWMQDLASVYNRGFWSGYYLGQKLGEFTDSSGSSAKQKKIFLGKGVHYYSHPKIGEFKISSQYLSVGDKILITGPTTGVIKTEVSELMVNDKNVETAQRGDLCTLPINEKIRVSDKLYKLIDLAK